MATATHYPDAGNYSSNQSSGLLASQTPGALSDWAGRPSLNSTQLTNLGTDDASGVSVAQGFQAPSTWYAAGVLARMTMTDGTVSQLDYTVKGHDPGGATATAYVYNFNTASFESKATHAGGAPGDWTLTWSITSSCSDYVDGSGRAWVLVTDDTNGTTMPVHFFKMVETYAPPEPTGNAAPGSQSQTHGTPSVSQKHVAGAAAAGQSQTAGQAAGDSWPSFGSPAAGQQGQAHGTPSGTQNHSAWPVAAGQAQTHGTPTVSQKHVVRAAAAGQGQTAGPASGSVAGFAATAQAPAAQGQTAGAPAVRQTHIAGAEAPAVQVQEAGPAGGAYEIRLLLSVTTSQARRLSWTAAGTVYVVIDGRQVGESDLGFLDLPADQAVRGVLLAYKTLPDPLPTPRDQVRLTVTGGPGVLHHILRRPSGGDWAEIAAILGESHVDGPLPDGTYDYQAIDENDAAGESEPSPTRTVTISSVPDSPSGLRYAWDAGAKTLTLTWQASPSPDVAAYRVREGLEPLDLDTAPVQESTALNNQRTFAGETGTFVWSVRAMDADGNEEQNVTQTLALAFQDGSLVVRPAEPRMVEVRPTAGHAVTVEFLYDPRYEDPAPPWGAVAGSGAAVEARIYSDGGTGKVDFGTPVDTLSMDGPVAPTRYIWTSGVLPQGATCLWVVRIVTASGIETQNTRAISAAGPASMDVPATPDISGVVV